ncbi:MAG: glycine-rich protein [Bacteroidota bacterium]
MRKATLSLLAALTLTAITGSSQVTQTFKYTGGVQKFVVPAYVTSITVDVVGASGGNVQTATGGKGGRVQCVVPVTPGETLLIHVGGAGQDADNSSGRIMGGYNGGGTGFDNDDDGWGGGGGGGASDICRSPYSLKKRLVVAGGGGGAGIDGCSASYLLNGGDGGGLTGADGQQAQGGGCDGSGFGGGQTKGGKRGEYTLNPCENRSTDGDFGMGGHGYGWCDNNDEGGSGGGGGWFGGGAGNFGAGGGGSSYAVPEAKDVEHTQGFHTGDGYVIISYKPGLVTAPASPGAVDGPAAICAYSTASYSIAEVSGASSYVWTVPADAKIVSGNGTTAIKVEFGKTQGHITVKAVNSKGESQKQLLAVEVSNLSAIATGVNASCSGGCTGQATASALNGIAPFTYEWSNGETTQTINNLCPGSYSVIITDASGCTAKAVQVISQQSSMTMNVTAEHDTICSGGSTMLHAKGGVSYKWAPESGLNCTSCASTLAKPTVTTTYTVTITDANGCTSVSTVLVHVLSCTGIMETGITSIQVYPVPFKDEFFISGLIAPENEITLINSMGEVVAVKTVGPGNCKLETGKLPAGVYFVTVKTKTGTIKKKVIKE